MENLDNLFSNLEKMGKEIGLPSMLIKGNIDKLKVLMKEKKAEDSSENILFNLGKEFGISDSLIKENIDKLKILMKETEAKEKAEENSFGNIMKEVFEKEKRADYHILEDTNNYTYLVDLPGTKSKENIFISIQNNVLNIVAKREKPENLISKDSYFGEIKKEIVLPENVGGIVASYEDGVLTIIVEKIKNTTKIIDIL